MVHNPGTPFQASVSRESSFALGPHLAKIRKPVLTSTRTERPEVQQFPRLCVDKTDSIIQNVTKNLLETLLENTFRRFPMVKFVLKPTNQKYILLEQVGAVNRQYLI